ncbi:ABC transporter related protein [Ferroglobus placidus DSM 10642]|uniref:ABC transporter related protein n=1 Tax=Ferroglobus placidus (strain DSM 10642 / AEDII12DO) TaxID=589924 RepID=D3S0I5_FERPA|nr:ABC transporter ATP-binding protein [Ferroglobus placidus]ADC64199.1 ABC transporter related protein [Ferroglobus placidus DSM 10642]
MKAVELRNVTKVYKTKYYEVVALRNVNLEVELGEFIAVMGPSGSGKSTLLNLVGCLDKPTEGEVIIKGRRTRELSDRELTKLRRDEIGFIFQQYNLIPTLTVEENIELPMVFKGISKEERERRVRELAEKLGIYELLERKPAELSGGQQQRVAIARALANKPSILLCDEPTGNLDSKSGEIVMEAIKELNEEGVTVILVTHDESLKRYAERVVKLRDGMIVDVSSNGS